MPKSRKRKLKTKSFKDKQTQYVPENTVTKIDSITGKKITKVQYARTIHH